MIRTLKRFLLFSGIFIFLAGICFGAERQFKDDQISLSFSEGWEVLHKESINKEAAHRMGWTEDELAEFFDYSGSILLSDKKIDGTYFQLDLFYYPQRQDYESEVKASYTDKELLSFHKSYGTACLKDIYSDIKSVGKATIFQGKNEKFIKVQTVSQSSEYDTYYSQFYYTIKNETVVCFQIMPLTDKLTGRQISEGEAVVSSFQDKGYYDVYRADTRISLILYIAIIVGSAILIGLLILLIRRFIVRTRRKRAAEVLSGQQDYHFDHDWGLKPAHLTRESARENADWRHVEKSEKAEKTEGRKVDV